MALPTERDKEVDSLVYDIIEKYMEKTFDDIDSLLINTGKVTEDEVTVTLNRYYEDFSGNWQEYINADS